MKQGKLLIISAPSGSGKSTIVNWLMKEHPELKLTFSISCTSRAPRGTEQNGVEYYFITADEFRMNSVKGLQGMSFWSMKRFTRTVSTAH